LLSTTAGTAAIYAVAKMPEALPASPVELRRWDARHLDALMAALTTSRAELEYWLPFAGSWPTRERERVWLASRGEGFDAGREYGYGMFAGDELVGDGSLLPVADSGAWQIGYWVRTDRTGRGYATAAARALTAAAFDHLGLESLQLRMDQANAASAAVPRKLGYVLTAEEDRPVLAPGQTGRGFIWTMTRDQWPGTAA
jgi:RimJ/RimL family protein N-acetyltransferase